ncbi:MAG: HDOD domain-containing protein [Gammaproteobacteria bacterium]|nr:HDOD domain-containing protein [Gammaproteobacteria bacterium]
MDAAVDLKNIENVLRGIVIPSPPQIIADLQMEMAMPDPDMSSMAALISKDAGLAGAVLKTVNSPLYGSSREISSIAQAVMMLGMQTIMDIINTLCLRQATTDVEKMTDNVYSTLTRFWDSAADVARVCGMVGKKIGLSPLDNAYLLGLFHNVGIALMIVKHDSFLDVMSDSYAQSEVRVVDVENDAIGSNHAVLSYFVARSWKIDSRLCRIISMHHDVNIFENPNVVDSSENVLLGVLKIAEHIVGLHRILGNQQVDQEWKKIADNVMLCVGLTSYELDDLKAQAAELGYGQQLYFR